jgi:fructosamine-3-kinase
MPAMLRHRGNTFWDIENPHEVRGLIMKSLVAWRDVYQQQRIASAVERMAERTGSVQYLQGDVVEKLERLRRLLDEGAINKDEYERLRRRIIEEAR